jgi:hypothetical protein
MGTKADFYTKDGEFLIWHGSIEWEGNEDNIPASILQSRSNQEFISNIELFLQKRNDAKLSKNGWPWHWDSSKQTDYTYIMVEEKATVYVSRYNSPCYSIYDYRNYKKRSKSAKQEGKTIEDFFSFVEKISTFTPSFPRMRDEQSSKNRRPHFEEEVRASTYIRQ